MLELEIYVLVSSFFVYIFGKYLLKLLDYDYDHAQMYCQSTTVDATDIHITLL